MWIAQTLQPEDWHSARMPSTKPPIGFTALTTTCTCMHAECSGGAKLTKQARLATLSSAPGAHGGGSAPAAVAPAAPAAGGSGLGARPRARTQLAPSGQGAGKQAGRAPPVTAAGGAMRPAAGASMRPAAGASMRPVPSRAGVSSIRLVASGSGVAGGHAAAAQRVERLPELLEDADLGPLVWQQLSADDKHALLLAGSHRLTSAVRGRVTGFTAEKPALGPPVDEHATLAALQGAVERYPGLQRVVWRGTFSEASIGALQQAVADCAGELAHLEIWKAGAPSMAPHLRQLAEVLQQVAASAAGKGSLRHLLLDVQGLASRGNMAVRDSIGSTLLSLAPSLKSLSIQRILLISECELGGSSAEQASGICPVAKPSRQQQYTTVQDVLRACTGAESMSLRGGVDVTDLLGILPALPAQLQSLALEGAVKVAEHASGSRPSPAQDPAITRAMAGLGRTLTNLRKLNLAMHFRSAASLGSVQCLADTLAVAPRLESLSLLLFVPVLGAAEFVSLWRSVGPAVSSLLQLSELRLAYGGNDKEADAMHAPEPLLPIKGCWAALQRARVFCG